MKRKLQKQPEKKQKGTKIRKTADLSLEATKAKRQWNSIITVLKGKNKRTCRSGGAELSIW